MNDQKLMPTSEAVIADRLLVTLALHHDDIKSTDLKATGEGWMVLVIFNDEGTLVLYDPSPWQAVVRAAWELLTGMEMGRGVSR